MQKGIHRFYLPIPLFPSQAEATFLQNPPIPLQPLTLIQRHLI